jgi:hypothetical protein
MEGSMKSDLVDLELAVHHETEKAVLVSETGDRAKAVWLPLQACEVEYKPITGCMVGGRKRPFRLATVTMRESLAVEKGLA